MKKMTPKERRSFQLYAENVESKCTASHEAYVACLGKTSFDRQACSSERSVMRTCIDKNVDITPIVAKTFARMNYNVAKYMAAAPLQ